MPDDPRVRLLLEAVGTCGGIAYVFAIVGRQIAAFRYALQRRAYLRDPPPLPAPPPTPAFHWIACEDCGDRVPAYGVEPCRGREENPVE